MWFILLSAPTVAQEGTWTVSVAGGLSVLHLTEVDDDGRSDIAAYRRLQIPIADYPPLTTAPSFEASIQYRFERDMAVRAFGSAVFPSTSTSYADATHSLSLERTLTSTIIGVDVLYFFPPLIGDSEVGLFIGLGRISANAQQTTYESEIIKSGAGTETRILQDAFATYDKSKLTVRTGVNGSIPLSGPLAISLTALYSFAPLGSLTGTIREFAAIREHETAIEFNYSTIDIKAGLSYSF